MAVNKRPKALPSGRPPTSRPKDRMSSERSKTIIRAHHRLHKAHAAALKTGDLQTAQSIMQQIEQYGGIKAYQAASKQGQAKDRGGDSSKVLVEWLQQSRLINGKSHTRQSAATNVLRCLEIGALSTNNHISMFPAVIHMTRIDLNSQGVGIEKQDFMQRPLPLDDTHRFDLISLSLVLNYVPDALGRGKMLERLTHFLRKDADDTIETRTILPALFLVLPLPCVANSRYLDEDLLLQIMNSFGFKMQHSRNTSKLCYYLFSWTGKVSPANVCKRKIKDGPGMNNFCISVSS